MQLCSCLAFHNLSVKDFNSGAKYSALMRRCDLEEMGFCSFVPRCLFSGSFQSLCVSKTGVQSSALPLERKEMHFMTLNGHTSIVTVFGIHKCCSAVSVPSDMQQAVPRLEFCRFFGCFSPPALSTPTSATLSGVCRCPPWLCPTKRAPAGGAPGAPERPRHPLSVCVY